jgi:hypothetical protein
MVNAKKLRISASQEQILSQEGEFTFRTTLHL